MQSWREYLILLDALTCFDIQKYYENEPKFKNVYSRNNLSNIVKDFTYAINLDECKSVVTKWIVLFVNVNSVTYYSFGVEHIPEEI